MESALIYKTKQSKNGTVTLIFVFAKELSRVPNNCSQKVSQFITICVSSSSSLLASISSVLINKVLAWLRLRKVYVLKASFSKSLLQIADLNFLSTIT